MAQCMPCPTTCMPQMQLIQFSPNRCVTHLLEGEPLSGVQLLLASDACTRACSAAWCSEEQALV